jgi:hypothetical protein
MDKTGENDMLVMRIDHCRDRLSGELITRSQESLPLFSCSLQLTPTIEYMKISQN